MSAKDALGGPGGVGPAGADGVARQKGGRLPGLMRAELSALDTEDLLFAYVLYRYLEISRRNALLAFLNSDAAEHEAAFAAAFGEQTGEQEEEFLSLLAGE